MPDALCTASREEMSSSPSLTRLISSQPGLDPARLPPARFPGEFAIASIALKVGQRQFKTSSGTGIRYQMIPVIKGGGFEDQNWTNDAS